MVFVCENCGFLFSRAGKQDHCPGCGKNLIRTANPVERHEYAAQVAGVIRERCVDAPRFPDMVETEIFVPNSFGFLLPATAFQIDSSMVVEIMVEYGESAANRLDLTANVWVRPKDGVQAEFLMSIDLPAEQGETEREQLNRVFSALSGNAIFATKVCDYITKQLKK